MKFLSVSALLVGLVAATEVNVLTTETFDKFVNSNPLVLAEFYAPWCGHCKALAPEYDDASEVLASGEHDIKLAKVDCTENDSLCASLDIKGYPTLFVFRGRDKFVPYTGGRKSEDIVSYMSKQALPAITPVDSSSFKNFKALDDVTVLAFTDDDKDDLDVFTQVAESLRESFVFGTSSDEALAAELGIEGGSGVVLFKTYDDPVTVFDGDFDVAALTAWIKAESFPLVGEIGPSTYAEYHGSGIPLLYVFVSTEDDKKSLTKILTPLAKTHKGVVNIAFIDAVQYGAHAPNVNLEEGKWPAMVIEDFKTGAKYPHDQDVDINKKSASSFLSSFAEGSLKPKLKSEEIPEEQPDAVYTLVGKTFEDLVVNSDKDVLVEFYAPWCGHCKNLAPTWEELATLYKGKYDDKVTVAKIDHTVNEVRGLDIRGYPTIKLFPAGSKEPIDYEGGRTLEAFAAFIKEKGTHQVDGLAKNDTAGEKVEKKAKKAKKTKKAKKAKKTAAKAEL